MSIRAKDPEDRTFSRSLSRLINSHRCLQVLFELFSAIGISNRIEYNRTEGRYLNNIRSSSAAVEAAAAAEAPVAPVTQMRFRRTFSNEPNERTILRIN